MLINRYSHAERCGVVVGVRGERKGGGEGAVRGHCLLGGGALALAVE